MTVKSRRLAFLEEKVVFPLFAIYTEEVGVRFTEAQSQSEL
jgi:hypothetical protein